jgi:Flp pilus assembly protein TadG
MRVESSQIAITEPDTQKADAASVNIRSRARRIRAGEQGQSLIEFLAASTILLLIVTGVTSFGITLHNFLILTNAVNAGAQQLSFSRGETTDPCATAYSAITAAAPTLTSGITLSFVINGSSYSGNSCTAGAAGMSQGAAAQVTATYPCTLSIYSMTYSSCSLRAQLTETIQ